MTNIVHLHRLLSLDANYSITLISPFCAISSLKYHAKVIDCGAYREAQICCWFGLLVCYFVCLFEFWLLTVRRIPYAHAMMRCALCRRQRQIETDALIDHCYEGWSIVLFDWDRLSYVCVYRVLILHWHLAEFYYIILSIYGNQPCALVCSVFTAWVIEPKWMFRNLIHAVPQSPKMQRQVSMYEYTRDQTTSWSQLSMNMY